MTFKVRRSGHIVIRVADVERSVAFFRDIVGLKIVGSTARNMFFMTADFEANHHMVLVRPAKPGATSGDPRSRIGLAAASFEIASMEDLKALHGRLVEFGAEIDRTEDRGSIKALFASDPDGNMFEFYCRSGGGTALGDYFDVQGNLDAELASTAS